MKSVVVILKIFIVMSILFSAITLAGFSDFYDSISLGFVVLMTFFLTIAGFSFKRIKNSVIAVFSSDTNCYILNESKEFWLSLIRNFIVTGVFGTLIGFVLILGGLDDPKKVDQMMSIAYLTVFYGFLFTLIFPVPAFFIIIEKLKSISSIETDELDHSQNKGGRASTIIGLIGIIITFLVAIDLPNFEISIFYNLPSILLVIGGGVAFTIFASFKKENLGGYLTLGFALSGLIGVMGGIIQMFKYSDNIAKIGPAAALALLSLFSALVGMMLISMPLSDNYQYICVDRKNKAVFRLFEFVFPILVLIFSTIIMFMIFAKT